MTTTTTIDANTIETNIIETLKKIDNVNHNLIDKTPFTIQKPRNYEHLNTDLMTLNLTFDFFEMKVCATLLSTKDARYMYDEPCTTTPDNIGVAAEHILSFDDIFKIKEPFKNIVNDEKLQQLLKTTEFSCYDFSKKFIQTRTQHLIPATEPFTNWKGDIERHWNKYSFM